jgi:tetratricopeptide (TPR) repeat protein
MNRATQRRRSRRRKVEMASRIGNKPLAMAGDSRAAVNQAPLNPLEVITLEHAAERSELHFEIATEDDVPVPQEKTNGRGIAEHPQGTSKVQSTPDASESDAKLSGADDTRKPKDRARRGSDNPSAEELLYNAAKEAHSQGETKRAMTIYQELLALKPDHVKARNNLGLLLDHMGDHEKALQQLQLCLEAEPDNPSVLVNRGGVLGALGRFPEAEQDLRRALEHDTNNAEAHFNLGLLMSRRGLWSAALPFLRRSIELDLGRATAYLYLGDALNHVDDLDGALQAYQRSVDLVPNNAKAFYGLGIIYDRLNRPEDAQQMYRRSRDLAGR